MNALYNDINPPFFFEDEKVEEKQIVCALCCDKFYPEETVTVDKEIQCIEHHIEWLQNKSNETYTKLVCSQSQDCQGCNGIHCKGAFDGSKKIINPKP